MTKVLIDLEALKRIHRDLDACQKVIHLAGGFDPAYCKDSQARLKEIDALLAAPAAPVVQAEQGPVAFQCHSCKAQTPPPAPFKWYVECKECGEKTAATAAAEFTNHAAQPAHPDALSQAAADVLAERRRQVEAEGWTPEHDDEHGHGQIARAAACYALSGSCAPDDETAAMLVDLTWPWPPRWWKPTTSRRDLVKAAALILAEIERLDRAALAAKDGEA